MLGGFIGRDGVGGGELAAQPGGGGGTGLPSSGFTQWDLRSEQAEKRVQLIKYLEYSAVASFQSLAGNLGCNQHLQGLERIEVKLAGWASGHTAVCGEVTCWQGKKGQSPASWDGRAESSVL